MKISLARLELKNFRSVADASLEFDASGMVLIQGNSGAGKSTINLAVAYVLGFCSIPQGQLQRWGTKEMSVSAEFLLDGEPFTVHRGTDYVGCDGPGEYSEIHGAKSVNSRVQSVLGITPEMLSALTYRPQQEPGAFLRMTDADKKQFLVEVLRLDQFEKAIEDSSARVKRLETDRIMGAKDVEHLEVAVKDAQATLVVPPSKADMELARAEQATEVERISAAKAQIAELEQLNPEASDKLELYRQANRHLDKAIADDDFRATEYQLARGEWKTKLAALTSKKTKAAGVVQKLEMLKGQEQKLRMGNCPTCGQSVADTDALERVRAQIELAQESYLPLTTKDLEELQVGEDFLATPFSPSPNIEKLRRIANKLYGEVQLAQEQNKSAVQALRVAIQQSERLVGDISRRIGTMVSAVQVAERSLEHLRGKQRALIEAQEKLTVISGVLAAEEDFAAMIGNQGFLGAIFEEVLQDISFDANEILGRVPNTASVTIEFKTESVTQKGSIKKAIVPVISVGGHVGTLDAALSGGMKTTVMLAVDLAVAKVIARRAGIQPGWLILDEPADGMDSASREAMYDLLAKESAERLVLVVDHAVDTKGLFTRTITAEMVGTTTTFTI